MPAIARVALVALLALGSFAGCAGKSDPQKIALDMTRAVYADDLAGFSAYFDASTQPTVTRADLGVLSDRMHALGDLQTVAQHDADPDKGRYTYDANFSRGSMLIELRVDPTGKVGAYRVIPESAPSK
jgi:hypothetical protein